MRPVHLIALGIAIVLVACSSPAATPGSTIEITPEAPATTPAPSPSVEPTSAAPSATEAPAESAWAAIDTAGPSPREDHTWTVDAAGEVAYLFGGRDGSTVFGDLWAYELATDTWSSIAADGGAAPRFGHEAVWVDQIGLVLFAGQAGPTTFFNDLWAYDPSASSWRQLPSTGDVPISRYGSCAAIGPDGRLWVSHGFTSDGTRFNDTLAYDFDSGAWTDETPEAPLPVNRCLHGCWWTDAGELALYGGQTTGVTALGDLWLLTDGAWTSVDGALPSDRNLYARARLPGGTLVFGGQTLDASFLADAHIFRDGEAGATPVELEGQAPPPRAGAEMVHDVARDRVLLFGGRNGEQAFGDLWELRGLPLEG